jgi:hypothetical protein
VNPGRNCATGIFLILVFVCAVLILDASAQPNGRLIVRRSPDFGTYSFVDLAIDGRLVAGIPRGQHYEGLLSAGDHVLSVLALPNTQARPPTILHLTVQPGRTYAFVVGWESDLLVLRKER